MPTGIEIGEVKIQGAEPMDVKLLFYHLLVLQAVFTGAIAGQIGNGDIRSGLKFGIGLLIATIILFESC